MFFTLPQWVFTMGFGASLATAVFLYLPEIKRIWAGLLQNFQPPKNVVTSDDVKAIKTVTSSEYKALKDRGALDPKTVYFQMSDDGENDGEG